MELQEYLGNSIVLKKYDVENFKNYIHKKYASESTLDRALVLADAINRIVDKHLEDIPENCKSELRKKIYINFIDSDYADITKLNIFDEITSESFYQRIGENSIIKWVANASEKKFRLTDVVKLVKLSIPVKADPYAMDEVAHIAMNTQIKSEESIILPINEENSIQIAAEIHEEFKAFERLEEFEIPEFLKFPSHKKFTRKRLKLNLNLDFQKFLMHFKFRMKPRYYLRYASLAAVVLVMLLIPSAKLDAKAKYIATPTGVYDIVSPTVITSEDVKKIEDEIKREKLLPENSRSGLKRESISFNNFKYRYFNSEKLRLFLSEKNSILATEPYFSTIIKVSKEYNYDPRLLFALTGQEQSFVSKKNPMAKEIANNPYNVFYSWKNYNTDITDSTEIAIKTIDRSLAKMPKGANPFKWMNRTYAEDPNWWRGFESIYKILVEITTT